MPTTKYNLQLKGFVGGADFDRNAVDRLLADQSGKHVNILIDSLGGSLATGLSISAAFKNHGDVAVHFVGLNASAATIASLGAAHISIDAGAMYLVHQCSTSFFEWGSLNAEQFAALIRDCEKVKADLDKLDLNVAAMYARKCKRTPEALLLLMKAGGWLTAQEALDWGFVDEITNLADEPTPRLTDALASAMASEGMPIPNIPLAEVEQKSSFRNFLNAITEYFRPSTQPIAIAMTKTYTKLCAILSIDAVTLQDSQATLSDEQLTSIEAALAQRDATIAELQARLEKQPAESSSQVINAQPKAEEPRNEVEQFVDTYNAAKTLFKQL